MLISDVYLIQREMNYVYRKESEVKTTNIQEGDLIAIMTMSLGFVYIIFHIRIAPYVQVTLTVWAFLSHSCRRYWISVVALDTTVLYRFIILKSTAVTLTRQAVPWTLEPKSAWLHSDFLTEQLLPAG